MMKKKKPQRRITIEISAPRIFQPIPTFLIAKRAIEELNIGSTNIQAKLTSGIITFDFEMNCFENNEGILFLDCVFLK
jgi:hypothetical protein